MKNLIIFLLICLPCFAIAQENSSAPDPETYRYTLRVNNVFRALIDEIRINFSHDRNDRYGYYLGYIHPNPVFTEILTDVNSNAQLYYFRKGYLAGFYVKPFQEGPVYLNFIYRNSTAEGVTHIQVSGGSSFNGRDTYVEREVSSYAFYLDYRKVIKKGRFLHEFYGGFGLKSRQVQTVYEDQSGFIDQLYPLDNDNGTFVAPTVHLGYNFGLKFK